MTTPHALIIRFDDYAARFTKDGQTDLQPLVLLADHLDGVLTADGLGEMDGYELADDGSVGTIYLYGENALSMYDAVRQAIKLPPSPAAAWRFSISAPSWMKPLRSTRSRSKAKWFRQAPWVIIQAD